MYGNDQNKLMIAEILAIDHGSDSPQVDLKEKQKEEEIIRN